VSRTIEEIEAEYNIAWEEYIKARTAKNLAYEKVDRLMKEFQQAKKEARDE
jgi:hypothetical protein